VSGKRSFIIIDHPIICKTDITHVNIYWPIGQQLFRVLGGWSDENMNLDIWLQTR